MTISVGTWGWFSDSPKNVAVWGWEDAVAIMVAGVTKIVNSQQGNKFIEWDKIIGFVNSEDVVKFINNIDIPSITYLNVGNKIVQRSIPTNTINRVGEYKFITLELTRKILLEDDRTNNYVLRNTGNINIINDSIIPKVVSA